MVQSPTLFMVFGLRYGVLCRKILGKPVEPPPRPASGSHYFKAASKIEDGEWNSLEEDYGLHHHEEEDVVVPLCEQPAFECLIGAMVMVNAVVMALELDLSSKTDTLTERIPWVVTDIFFCTIFGFEIVFRIWCVGILDFLKHMRHWGDCLLVSLNIADTSIQLSMGNSTGLQSLSALRILRLFKMMKIFRIVSHVKELSLIATGLVSALKSLQWVSLLLALVIFVMAVMFKILVGQKCDSQEFQEAFTYHFGDAVHPIEKCEEFWGTVFRCMYTLYQITTLESWSQVIARPIWDVKPHYILLILSFQLITTFGLLNIVVAAVVDGTMNSTDELVVENQKLKESLSHLGVVRELFQAAANDEKRVTMDRLVPVLLDPIMRRKLLLLDISYDDPAQVYRILDSNEKGTTDVGEFTRGLMRMRGNAKSKDLLAIRAQLYRMDRELAAKINEVKDLKSISISPQVTNEDVFSRQVDRLAAISKAQIAKFSDEVQSQISKLSQEFQERIGSLEGQFGRAAGSRGPVWGIDDQLLTAEASKPVQLGRDPRMLNGHACDTWQKSCCTIASAGPEEIHQVVGPKLFATGRERPNLVSSLAKEYESLTRFSQERQNFLLASTTGYPPGRTGLGNGWNTLPQAPGMPLQSPGMPLQSPGTPVAAGLLQAIPQKRAVSLNTTFAQTDMTLLNGGSLIASQAADCLSMQDKDTSSKAVAADSSPPTWEYGASGPQSASIDQVGSVNNSTLGKEASKAVAASMEEPEGDSKIATAHLGKFSSADQPINKIDNVKTAESHIEADFQKKFEAFVRGPVFESIFALLIVLNACVMAAEVQYSGIDAGFKIRFEGSNRSAADTWPGAEEIFRSVEITFGVIFVLELILKIVALRLTFLRSMWNLLDTIIVGGWLLDTAVTTALNPMMLRLFRLVKLLRIAKLFKRFQAFDSLSILIGSMKASVSVLFWSIVVIFVVQLAGALLFCQLLQSHITEDWDGTGASSRENRETVYRYFGTFSRSFLTMSELTLGQWGPICRLLTDNVSEWYAILVGCYVLLVSFAAIKVISAVFIFETQKMASSDEGLLILQKERQNARLDNNFRSVFKEIDDSGDGSVNMEEFTEILEDHRVTTWLAALDLDIQQCQGLFELLDNGDGKISFQEFVQGVHRLKGAAKAVDLVTVSHQQAEMMKCVKKLLKMMEGGS